MNSILHLDSSINDNFYKEKLLAEYFNDLAAKYGNFDNLKKAMQGYISAPEITRSNTSLSDLAQLYHIQDYLIIYSTEYEEYVNINGHIFSINSQGAHVDNFYSKLLDKWNQSLIRYNESYHDYSYYNGLSYNDPVEFYLYNNGKGHLNFSEYLTNLYNEKDFNLFSVFIN